MKAIAYDRYGPPDVLELRDVDQPAAKDDEVLVRVHAASVNPADWHLMTGTPYIARLEAGLRKPKVQTPGIDVAGRVEAVGGNVTQFRPDDEVFGAHSSTFAEHVGVPEDEIALKPANLTFEQAAAVPVAGVTPCRVFATRDGFSQGRRS
jgi:NADPH:quinone reductase-like Zn-dependent oxidoreductase